MERVIISKLVDSDRNAVFDLLQNSSAMTFLGPRRPLTDSEAEVWFTNEQQAETGFAFRSTETNEIVGFCGVTQLDGELDFGYFVRPKFWGQGLASIMCESAIAKLAQSIDFSQVRVFIASENLGSQKVAHKLGWSLKCEAENEFESGYLYQVHI